MAFFPRHVATCPSLGKVVLALFLHIVDGLLMQRFLVAFERQNLVRFPFHNLGRDGLLSSHGINGDIVPSMSTSFKSSGMAVVSFDFSAQAT